MYRALSLVLLLLVACIALAFSAIAIKSLEPVHLGIALSVWYGVAWYFRYRRHALSTLGRSQVPEHPSVFAVTPSVLGVLAVTFAVTAGVLALTGWLERPGMWFVYFALSGSLAVVALGVLVVLRETKRSKKAVSSKSIG